MMPLRHSLSENGSYIDAGPILCGREMTVEEYTEEVVVFGPRTMVFVEPDTGDVTGLSCTFDF